VWRFLSFCDGVKWLGQTGPYLGVSLCVSGSYVVSLLSISMACCVVDDGLTRRAMPSVFAFSLVARRIGDI